MENSKTVETFTRDRTSQTRKTFHGLTNIAVLLMATMLWLGLSGVASEKAAVAAEDGPASAATYLKLLSAGDLVELDTSTDFVDIPGMTADVNFHRRNTCITAVFSAEVEGLEMHLRALLDDALMEGHRIDISAVVHTTATGFANLISYTFWQCDVSRGAHTVKIQWRTPRPSIAVTGRTLIVEGR